jgi:hypothetical protein
MDTPPPPDPAAAGLMTAGELAHLLVDPHVRSKPVRFRCGARMLVCTGHRAGADKSLILVLREALADEQAAEYAATMPATAIRERKPRGKAVAK